jgi:hypothetical protein
MDTGRHDLADRLEAIAAQLRSQEPESAPARDWLAELLDTKAGDVIGTDVAAQIAAVHPDTMRKRAVTAMEEGKPIAALAAGAAWFFSERHLLDDIEARGGLPARLEAATRAQKARDFRSKPSLSAQKPIATEPESSTIRAKSSR